MRFFYYRDKKLSHCTIDFFSINDIIVVKEIYFTHFYVLQEAIKMFNASVLLDFSRMLSATLGMMMQVTLSDTKHYLFVENAIDDDIAVGKAIHERELALFKTANLTGTPFVANYKNLSSNMNRLRASSFFFKDTETENVYILTITANVDEFVRIREIMNIFTNGVTPKFSEEFIEDEIVTNRDFNIDDAIYDVIAEGEHRYSTKRIEMTTNEKHSLIREMNTRGVFLIKGAVSNVAEKLNYSEATIYRYLKKLEEEN